MTLTRREKIMIVAGLIIVALASYIFYFFIPYMNNTNDAIKRFGDTQTQLNLLKTKQTLSVQLKSEIDDLTNQLKNEGSAVPAGVDDARILLYLKKITDGRVEKLVINVPKDPELTNRFLVQGVTVKFNTTYQEYLTIIGDLKKNELFSRVSFLQVTYSTNATAGAEQPLGGTGNPGEPVSPEATQAPLAPDDKNVLSVQLELNFYAVQPSDGNTVAQPLAPITASRSSSLMPVK